MTGSAKATGRRDGVRRHARCVGGYILVETTVALVLLAVGSWAIHATIREAILARGQAQDYTQARFLLEEVVAKLELQPLLSHGSKRGTFPGDLSRFSWSYTVKRVDVPAPSAPTGIGRRQNQPPVEFVAEFLTGVQATVTWTRGGREFSESFETLFRPSKFWEPD